MSRTLVNLLLDIVLLMVFLALSWVSIVVHFVFPPGTTAAGWTLWGQSFDWWSTQQFNTLALLAVGILVHVMLHWTWVCGTIAMQLRRSRRGEASGKIDDGTRTLYGVATIVVIVNIVGLLIAAASLMIRSPSAS